jgi:hypothetical protein
MGRQKKTTAKTYEVVLTQTASHNIDEITGYIAFINQQPVNAIKVGNALFENIAYWQAPFSFQGMRRAGN